MREVDKKAVKAANDKSALDSLLLEYESYILSCASKVMKRYVTKSDDEWSIAIGAFYQAVLNYSPEKGSFLAFSKMMITRRLIDYLRGQNKFQVEMPVSPFVFSGEDEEEEAPFIKIPTPTIFERENTLKDEIEAVNGRFATYGFSFYDLISCSPKAQKTKEACYRAVSYMALNHELCCEMQRTKNLPQKIIAKNTKIPQKILERHRKYIIAAIEITIGDYPGLLNYIKPFKEASIE